jgi:hypothetical protein
MEGSQAQIDTKFWKPGVYILKFQVDNIQMVKRVIKKQ